MVQIEINIKDVPQISQINAEKKLANISVISGENKQ